MPSPMPADRLAANPLPQPHQPPAVSRSKASAILGQRQFRGARPSLIEQFLRWLSQHLAAIRIPGGGPAAVIGWLVLLGAVGVVVALVVYGTRTLRRDTERSDAAMQVAVRRSATDWLDRADRFEREGAWKEGLRCRYRALITELISAKVVGELPGRTTGEYRGDVTATVPEAGPDFSGASELFDRAWYGDRPTGPDERDRFNQLADAVLTRARRRSSPSGATTDSDQDRARPGVAVTAIVAAPDEDSVPASAPEPELTDPDSAGRDAPAGRARRWRRRLPWLVGLAGLLVAVVVLGAPGRPPACTP